MELLYYLIESTSEYYTSYKQIRNFIKNNKLKDEVVFKDLYISNGKFILLSSKKCMKELETLCNKINLSASRIIYESLDDNFNLICKNKDININAKIDVENQSIVLATDEAEYIFKILLNIDKED